MDTIELIPKLLRSSLDRDQKMIEATALMMMKKMRKDYPLVADEVAQLLAQRGTSGNNTRSVNAQPLPVDRESRYELVEIEYQIDVPEPILDDYSKQQIDDFIRERNMIPQFLKAGIIPPNSLLLSGQPGVGKTYISKWISGELNLPLITLDLATSISSYLGRSGQNIRSIFDYAKTQPSVLLLDELDAIAKRRDDSGDLGELKRLVNVLLKEIENYPTTGIIIGATNHPELLDKAIWRRFDRALVIPMPDIVERKKLLYRHLDDYAKGIGEHTVDYIATNTGGVNAADICKLCEHIKRQSLLCPETQIKLVALSEVFKVITLKDMDRKREVCRKIRSEYPEISQRDISQITHIPLTSVSRYLAKGKKEEEDE